MAERGSGTELVDVRDNLHNLIYRKQKLNTKSVLGLGTMKTIFFQFFFGKQVVTFVPLFLERRSKCQWDM